MGEENFQEIKNFAYNKHEKHLAIERGRDISYREDSYKFYNRICKKIMEDKGLSDKKQ